MLATLADQAVQRPRVAVRDQVGRLPRPGGRRRRRGPDLDAQPQRRRDVLPAAPATTDLDRRPAGDRRRRGRRPRRGRPPGLRPAPGAPRRQGRARARLPGVRPALPRRAVAARRRRSRTASACSRACSGRIRASASPPTSRADGETFHEAAGRAGARGHRRQAPPLALRAGPPIDGLAEDQDPPGAGARRRRLDDRRRATPRTSGRWPSASTRTASCGSPARSAPGSPPRPAGRCSSGSRR